MYAEINGQPIKHYDNNTVQIFGLKLIGSAEFI
jgi:hypothetical protein